MEHTSKNFALQLGALLSLYVSIGALISLIFGIITVLYPDPASYMWESESARMQIRTAIAVLTVFLPTYLVLTRIVNQVRRHEEGTYLALTRWIVYISLLVGGAVLLGDLVTVLNSFLSGELTIRFMFKALTVLIVVGSAFAYYLLDVRGYWHDHERESIRYGAASALIAAVAMIVGFTYIETPSEVREMNIDRKELQDLMIIQGQVESYAVKRGVLPSTIEEAFDGLPIPEAPDSRPAYVYEVLSDDRFELCAEFAYGTGAYERSFAPGYVDERMMIIQPHDWNHGSGTWCFERILAETRVTR